jgi:hypothetical protein
MDRPTVDTRLVDLRPGIDRELGLAVVIPAPDRPKSDTPSDRPSSIVRSPARAIPPTRTTTRTITVQPNRIRIIATS